VFIEEYLQELRQERFAPHAVARYIRRSLARARESIVDNPGAARSIWSLGLVFFALCFVASAVLAVADDRRLALDFFLLTTLATTPVFGLVSLHVDLLRDRDGYRLSAVNLPTALTLLRIALAPGIVLFLVQGHVALALAVYVAAELSDVADGWLARRWHQVTRLGTMLDPIVDIAFNVLVFVGLRQAGMIPGWVLAAALLRYAILLFGGAGLYVFVGPVTIHPTLFGRLSGVVMVGLVSFLVLLHAAPVPWAPRLIPLTSTAIGVLFVAAVVQVAALGWYNLRVMKGEATARGQVVGDVRWGPR
jgi:cardiolipin synthase (CMP-forming)